jgi:NAD(P)-dependent dehydrogenase (short-subunit alcohol dehydrogenase family)
LPIADVSHLGLAQLLSLEGRVAVVTGGAAGIGAAIASRLAEGGASVLIGDKGIFDKAEESAARLAEQSGRRVVGTTLDVTDESSVNECADLAMAEFGRLDIWVNNAGTYPMQPLLEMTAQDWDNVINVNLRGAFLGSQAAAKRMIEAGNGGVIINLASTGSFKASSPGVVHYISAKHGVAGLTKSLAIDLGPHNIRVLAVAPTVIRGTPGNDAARAARSARGLGGDVDAHSARLPLGRTGVADDVGRVAYFCATDLSMFMTGAILPVDAGDLCL